MKETINKVIEWGSNLAQKGKEGATNLFNNVIDTIKELPSKMLEIGKNIVEGIWNGITGAKDWLKNKVGEFANGILNGMKEALGIHSPSSKARDLIGKFIPAGVAVGVKANTEEALKAIRNMDNEIMAEMNRAVSIEIGSINAKASLQANQNQPTVIARDHTIKIENTQQFYSSNATPYEQQKEAKQQLRRLAYGL